MFPTPTLIVYLMKPCESSNISAGHKLDHSVSIYRQTDRQTHTHTHTHTHTRTHARTHARQARSRGELDSHEEVRHFCGSRRDQVVAAQWRGDTALTFVIVLAAVHGSLALPGRCLLSSLSFILSSSSPPPPPPLVNILNVPKKHSRFCGR